MNSNQTLAPVVDCQQVLALVRHAERLPDDEQDQLFNDLERDPEFGPLVVSEARSHLQHRPS